MIREQLEKAALLFAGAGEWGECPYNPDAKTGFMAGAEWRINSVWHDDISECKDVKRWIVVEYNNGYIDVLPDIRDLDGVKDLVVRVAYVDDLLPERKEETK
ncbi:hypothetical protein H6B14_04600 [Phocaeicola coprophilus]|nr:hypothetical protein [Phocaeicola coprophilus]